MRCERRRVLIAALVTTIGSGCMRSSGSRHAESKAASEVKAKKVSMTQDMASEAKRIVGMLANASEFKKTKIEELLGVSLARPPEVAPEFFYYEAELPSGPFSQIELREPNPSQARTWLVLLTVREGIELPLSAFENDPIPPGPPQDIQPRVPPEGTITYIVKSPPQSIHYAFRAQSEMLQVVALHRPPR
jgi:hypothetical protein